jgi:hypothetical protein
MITQTYEYTTRLNVENSCRCTKKLALPPLLCAEKYLPAFLKL